MTIHDIKSTIARIARNSPCFDVDYLFPHLDDFLETPNEEDLNEAMKDDICDYFGVVQAFLDTAKRKESNPDARMLYSQAIVLLKKVLWDICKAIDEYAGEREEEEA